MFIRFRRAVEYCTVHDSVGALRLEGVCFCFMNAPVYICIHTSHLLPAFLFLRMLLSTSCCMYRSFVRPFGGQSQVERYYLRALNIYTNCLGPNDPNVTKTKTNLVCACYYYLLAFRFRHTFYSRLPSPLLCEI